MRSICFLFVIISFLISKDSFAQLRPLHKKNHNVNKVLKDVKVFPDFETAGLAFYAIDMNTGEVIAQYNSNMVLKPASTQKLITTATALNILGPDYRFRTLLQYSGVIDTLNKVLHGNVYILGGGDPTLGSKYFAETSGGQFLVQWLNALKKLGVDSITGNIIGDARIYDMDMVPSTWSWINMGNYFGAGACGLTIYDNYYTIHFKTGNEFGDSTQIVDVVPSISGLTFDNGVWSDSITYDNTNIYGAPYCSERFVRGTLPLNKDDFTVKGSTPDPAYLAALELYRKLSADSVKIGGQATTCIKLKRGGVEMETNRVSFDTLLSPPLDSIIKQTNVHSINLFAEHCLLQAAIKLGTIAQVDSAVQALESYWKANGMDVQGLSLNDGSGLSHYNLINPKQMVFLLNYMHKQSPFANSFYQSMPVAGESGTMKNLCKNTPAQGNMRAKSGTVSRVKSFAGYVTSLSGREIAFSMVVNNYSGSTGKATLQLEKLMVALAEFDK